MLGHNCSVWPQSLHSMLHFLTKGKLPSVILYGHSGDLWWKQSITMAEEIKKTPLKGGSLMALVINSNQMI